MREMMPELMDDCVLYRMVDEVLHYIWDPIGLAGSPRARDEYYCYVPGAFKLVRDGANASDISAYLEEIAVNGMGLPANPEVQLKVASLLLEWKEIVRISPSTLRTSPPPMPAYDE